MAVFDYLRVSLSRPIAGGLLELYGVEPEPKKSRAEWFEDAFSERRDFFHRGKQYSFLPRGDAEGFATGFFGRDNSGKGRAGPDDDFQEIQLENWDLAFFCINLASDSQIALMQYNGKVGSTRAIIIAFLESLLKHEDFRDWNPHVEFLTLESSFYDVAERYRGQITQLKFMFVPPNALQATEKINDLIKDAKEQVNAEILTHIYDDPKGKLDPRGEIIEGSVTIASRGGGSAEIKVGKRTVFSDRSSKRTEQVGKEDIPDPERPITILGFIANVFRP